MQCVDLFKNICYGKKTLPLSLFKSCWGSRGCVALMSSYYAHWQRRGCGSGQMATDPYQWPVWPVWGGGRGGSVALFYNNEISCLSDRCASQLFTQAGTPALSLQTLVPFLYLSVLHSFILSSLLIVMNYFDLICYGFCRLLLKIYCL